MYPSASVLAQNVKIENTQSSSSNNRDKIEGMVCSINGDQLELDLKQASFIPSGNIVTVNNLSNASFHRGQLASLSNDQRIEIRGRWDGSRFNANRIEIEGGQSVLESGNNYSDDYLQLSGTLQIDSNGNKKLLVNEVEHSQKISKNTLLSLDLSKSWYQHGMSSCH